MFTFIPAGGGVILKVKFPHWRSPKEQETTPGEKENVTATLFIILIIIFSYLQYQECK